MPHVLHKNLMRKPTKSNCWRWSTRSFPPDGMKNIELWRPSKFIYRKNKLMGSRDPKEVGISSRLMADIVAAHYDQHLKQHVGGKLVDLGCGKVPLYAAYRDL